MTLKEAIDAAHEAEQACRERGEYDSMLARLRDVALADLRDALIEALAGPR